MSAILPSDPLWYKDAVIYQAHVRAFFDSTNDGVGDFAGLTRKLPYLESLGVNCLWLLPFFALIPLLIGLYHLVRSRFRHA